MTAQIVNYENRSNVTTAAPVPVAMTAAPVLVATTVVPVPVATTVILVSVATTVAPVPVAMTVATTAAPDSDCLKKTIGLCSIELQ
jgi:hypothetical protein